MYRRTLCTEVAVALFAQTICFIDFQRKYSSAAVIVKTFTATLVDRRVIIHNYGV